MMKKILLFIIIIIFVSFSLLAEIKARVPVGFTSGRTHNIGFSTSRVSGSMEPDTKLETVTFSVSSDFSSYTTGPFYMYLQLFTVEPVKVSMEATMLSDGVNYIGYTNSGSNTLPDFRGVDAESDQKDIELFTEPNPTSGSGYTMPRTYNFEFNFSVPVEAIKSTSEYKGTISIKLETI